MKLWETTAMDRLPEEWVLLLLLLLLLLHVLHWSRHEMAAISQMAFSWQIVFDGSMFSRF